MANYDPYADFDSAACSRCVGTDQATIPPCFLVQSDANTRHRTSLGVIESPGGMCGFHANWGDLADDLTTHNYVLQGGQDRFRVIQDLTQKLAAYKKRFHGRGDNPKSKFAALQCSYLETPDEVVYERVTKYVVIRAAPNNPRFDAIQDFFSDEVIQHPKTLTTYERSRWQYCAAGGGGGQLVIAVGSSGTLVLRDTAKRLWRFKFVIGGAPIPLPGSPVSVSYSRETAPGTGVVFKSNGTGELKLADFTSGQCTFFNASLCAGLGWQGSMIGVGPSSRFKALIFMQGVACGLPGGDVCEGKLTLVGAARDLPDSGWDR